MRPSRLFFALCLAVLAEDTFSFTCSHLIHDASVPRLSTRQHSSRRAARAGIVCSATSADVEQSLMKLIRQTRGRGQRATQEQLQEIQSAIDNLEEAGGVADPAVSSLIEGDWELLYTSKSKFDLRNPLGKRVDGTKPGLEGVLSSILGEDSKTEIAAEGIGVQRTVTSIEGITITQNIRLQGQDPRVDQYVRFGSGENLYLRLSAAATVDRATSKRISFTFDLAYFQVPFRLLGDEAKGWLDTTFLSQNLRMSG
ncbi:hypothetical protein GUITHDRAFT_138552 [Guillardia theta CCMP2712]|uniref:Plastid lipid-associated protein/fibrillin conserved domain-containing protein n=1 Tax=Guillardia theta (strain CCMP2712) TaxID=905079 RepID=L1JCM4_GUITC|nr:hypothetical protein GUITHDRAFT_138552 [Guillardia theta CCMP2712]EKX46077.1 hypothetical protein GUITHDRAFT_138552 [Guillardia theta CCMP2712]|eukprot:XP_005833057.1 hypothetical protein GUITHDRAFT_138552 [Guillardia theta CCMP2712]